MRRLSVLVAAQHRLLREATAAVLALDRRVDIVALAAGAREAFEAAVEMRPDVALLAAYIPDASMLEACTGIRNRVPTTQVLVLGMSRRDEDFQAAVGAGAAGYVHSDMGALDLVAAVLAAGRADSATARPTRPRTELGAAEPVAPDAGPAALSERERDVLRLIAEGLTNREIAQTLDVRESTVKTHVRHVLNKLRVRNRAAAVAAYRPLETR